MLSSLIKKNKEQYYRNLFREANDARVVWKNVNKVLGRSGRSLVDIALNINGAVVNDNLSVANELNEYFKSVAVNLNREIPGSAVDPLFFVTGLPHFFVCMPTDHSEVKKIICSVFNKKCNVHTIPVFIYKLISSIIGGVASKLINFSFSSGVFPSFLIISRVIPSFKSGDKYKKENFRPISILHFISKIFEKCYA